MADRPGDAMAAFAVLAACACNAPDTASIDAPPPDAMRFLTCARVGTSMASGSGPDGALDASHVYALALTGFCGGVVELVVTTEDPLASPYLDHSGVIYARPEGSLAGTAEWSGTFAATISRPDGTAAGHGTLQVDKGTPAYPSPTQLRATARFNNGSWQFTATIDAPYCEVVNCI